jgi:L-fucose isomerase-like protein
MKKMTFAILFGNRGFFPESLIATARRDMALRLKQCGHQALMMAPDATKYGAVESVEDGEKFARFLKRNAGKVDGVIVCLPNFGDETGAVAAVRDAGVPILIQAYPDELDKMGFSMRRDAFCGKFSIMDVFCQYGLPFTTFPPHTVHPSSATFAQHLDWFAGVCRVANGMKRMTVGAVGARTTAFKTVRFDEVTLQRYGITTEALDLSEVISRVRAKKSNDKACRVTAARLKAYTNWKGTPAAALDTLTKLSVVLDELVAEYKMDALSLRCWIELEKQLNIAPCVVLGDLNDRGIPAACELDVGNAIAMYALFLASKKASTCLDWNNNYGDEPDKCILFHCGPVPQSLMTAKGRVIDHPMFAKALGAGCGVGCNVGRIAATPMTFASSKTQDGKLSFYLGEGSFTGDPIAEDFFGCAGVAEIAGLQGKLEVIGHAGYRHHVGVTAGHVATGVREAFQRYLHYDLTAL